jgi:O-antigen/teichoic acid export membrane protein
MVISQITNSSISSNIATLYDSGKLNDLQKMIHRVTFGLIIVGSIPLFLFVFFGKPILSIWGDDFSKAFWILVILGIGQFFKIGVGAAGQLLVMCGYQKIQGYISLTFTAMYIILNYILIINFGAIGAAVSTSITVIGINLSKVVFAKLKTGILTIPFTKK